MPLRPLRPLLLPRALGPLHSETPVAGGIECDTRGSGRSEAEQGGAMGSAAREVESSVDDRVFQRIGCFGPLQLRRSQAVFSSHV